jgi:anti-anti-sigma regulatory factor
VVDLGAVSRLDYSGAASLARIVEELRGAEVRVEIVHVNPGARRGVRVHIDGLDD